MAMVASDRPQPFDCGRAATTIFSTRLFLFQLDFDLILFANFAADVSVCISR